MNFSELQIIRRLSLVCLLMFTSQNFLPTQAAENISAKESGHVLKQKSKLAGDAEVTLTAHGLKVKFERTSMVLISKAPKWDVSAYNLSTHTTYSCPIQKFCGFNRIGFAVAVGFYTVNVPVCKTAASERYANIDTIVYETSPTYVKEIKENLKREGKIQGYIKSARVLTAKGWNLPEQEGLILSRLYGLSEVKEPPLRFNTVDCDGDKKEGLATDSIEKIQTTQSDFNEPVGYRRVSSFETVRLDKQGENGMESLLDTLTPRESDKRH